MVDAIALELLAWITLADEYLAKPQLRVYDAK
jgi:hypothetical protein